MGKIYAKATRTLIFLGPESPGSEDASCVLSHVGEQLIRHGTILSKEWSETFDACVNRLIENGEQPFWEKVAAGRSGTSFWTSHISLDALVCHLLGEEARTMVTHVSTIMERPWWRRIWVRSL